MLLSVYNLLQDVADEGSYGDWNITRVTLQEGCVCSCFLCLWWHLKDVGSGGRSVVYARRWVPMK